MKGLGLVACAFLASGIAAASADTPRKSHYKQNGDLCTAEEIVNPPVARVRYRSSVSKIKVVCLTKSGWIIETSMKDDKNRYEERDRQLMNENAQGASDNMGLISK